MLKLRFNKEQKAALPDPEIDFRRIENLIRENSDKYWLSCTIPVQEIDPLACIEQQILQKNLFYWEKPDEEFAIASGGITATLNADGAGRFDDIGKQSRELEENLLAVSTLGPPSTTPFLVGGYSFSDHSTHTMWKNFGSARFHLPEWSLLKSGTVHLLTLSLPLAGRTPPDIIEDIESGFSDFLQNCQAIRDTPPPASYGFSRKQSRWQQNGKSFPGWRRQVNKSRQKIAEGIFKKIVIARELDVETDQPIRVPRAMYHLRRRFPGCFNFMVKMNGSPIFMGATPERLVSLKRHRILTDGLAGSTSRGESAMEDLALGQDLMKSSKERSEHYFVVEDIRKNLKPYSVNVEHPRKPVIKKLNNVQHLYTPISAEARQKITIHEIAGALHPTPAVGGFPKLAAIPHINEIEEVDRGWYAGPVGWFNLSGSGEFAVAIRSAWIDGSRARLYAGSGIVKDSDPEKEWMETEMKLNPVLEALKLATND